MSYATIAQSTQDDAFVARVTAATVQEAWNNPEHAATVYGQDVQRGAPNAERMVYPTAAASDVEAAYASALAIGHPDPGGDESVITDAMILANVAAKWPPDTA